MKSSKRLVRGGGILVLLGASLMGTGCGQLQGLLQGLTQRGGAAGGALGAPAAAGGNPRQAGAPMQGARMAQLSPQAPGQRTSQRPGPPVSAGSPPAPGQRPQGPGSAPRSEQTFTADEWAAYWGVPVITPNGTNDRLTSTQAAAGVRRGSALMAEKQNEQTPPAPPATAPAPRSATESTSPFDYVIQT